MSTPNPRTPAQPLRYHPMQKRTRPVARVVDRERLERCLQELHLATRSLEGYRESLSLEEYRASPEAQAMVERLMTGAVDTCADLARQLLTALDPPAGLGSAHLLDAHLHTSFTDLFLKLARKGVLPEDFTVKMVELASLHRGLAEDEEEARRDLYYHLKNSIYRLRGFAFFCERALPQV